MLAVEKRAPWLLDEDTDFPLPLFPTLDAPNVYTRRGELYHKDPDDHHFFFPRKTFTDDNLPPGGKVVRVSRIQTVRRYHHDAAHKLMAPPPEISDPERQFGMSVLALSNFIPRQAIDVRGVDPRVVDLSDAEYALLRDMTRVDFVPAYHATIGKFFIDVLAANHLTAVDEATRCQFLEAEQNSASKRAFGMRILKMMSLDAVTPLNPTVHDLKKQGEIPLEQPSPYKTVLLYSRKVKNGHKYLESALAAA
jgi:hypothetical protein